MAETFELEIATLELAVVRARSREAQILTERGYVGILPGHAALLGQLGIGELTYVSDGQKRNLVIQGGFLEVVHDHVRVLADKAERPDEIDAKRAEAAMKRAADRLSRPDVGVDVARALNAMRRAQARLEAAKRQ